MNHKNTKKYLHQRKHKHKIVYPYLVEQMYQYWHDKGDKITKAEVFVVMVDIGMIDRQGNPSKWAIDQGYFKEISPKEAFINQAKSTIQSYANSVTTTSPLRMMVSLPPTRQWCLPSLMTLSETRPQAKRK